MLLRSAFAYGVFCLAAVSARSPPKVFMIRHGEKPPNRDDHGLTLDGIKRSQCLRDIFGRDSGYDIGHIMAPTVKWSESRNIYPNDQFLELDGHDEVEKNRWTNITLFHRRRASTSVYDRAPSRQ